MTVEEKQKLDNFKAHYGVILNNIRIANDELSSKLKELEAIKNNIANLRTSEQALHVSISVLNSKAEEKTKELDARENSLAAESERLKRDEGSLLAEKQAFAIEQDDKKKVLEAELLALRGSIIDANKKLEEMQGEVELSTLRLQSLSNEIKNLESFSASVRNEIQNLTKELEMVERQANAKKIELVNEISALEEKKRIVIKSTADAHAILDDREKQIQERERGVDVWARRINRKIKLLYPGQDLKF